MQVFNITQFSTLPYLEMEVINDGRHDFNHVYLALQSAEVTFSMINNDNNIKKIANAKSYVVPIEDNGCIEKVKIQYRWNERDTKEKGQFKGCFKIKFTDNIIMDGVTFPKGDLIVPIADELIINIL